MSAQAMSSRHLSRFAHFPKDPGSLNLQGWELGGGCTKCWGAQGRHGAVGMFWGAWHIHTVGWGCGLKGNVSLGGTSSNTETYVLE